MNYNSGFRSGSNPKWAVTSINRILTNELYIGTMVQGKNRKINYKVKKSSPIEKENWIRVENTHEAIIPEETFQYVQNLLELDTQRFTQRKNRFIYSLVSYGAGLWIEYGQKKHDKEWKKILLLSFARLIKNKRDASFTFDQRTTCV